VSQFDFWQQWGAQLDDTQFANAWAALGVVWNRGLDSPREALEHSFMIPPGYRVPWRFPREDASADLIAGTTPLEWAAAWSELAGGRDLRLAVSDAPDGEPVMPWLRLLSETKPATSAVGIDLAGWPEREVRIAPRLRLGFLPGNGAESSLDIPAIAAAAGPSVAVSIGPASPDCDVLVFRGTPAELLKNTAVVGRANFLLLLGAEGPDYGSDRAKADWDLNLLGAAGYASSRFWPPPGEMTARLSRLIQEIAQDKYFDEAVAAAFDRMDLYAAFTAALASHRLSQPVPPIPQQAPAPEPLGAAPESAPVPPPPPPPPAPPPPPKRTMFSWLRRRGVSPPAPKDASPTPRPTARAPAPGPLTRATGPSPAARVEPPRPRELETAVDSTDEQPQASARFLQQQSFAQHQGEMREATHGFIAARPARVKVFIGSPRASWNAAPTAFPSHLLPQEMDKWALDIWLTEPEHLAEPLARQVELPREGDSNEVDFDFIPRGNGPSFEGRLTVVHRGRVIQTAVLRASVQPDAPALQPGSPPRLEDLIPVRQSIGDLKHRMPFDLAFVLNNTAAGRPISVGLSAKHAWLSDLSQAKAIAGDISERLAPIAKSAVDYADGVTGKKGLALLIQLAQAGSLLHEFLVKQQINASGNRPEIAGAEYLQVVSTKLDAVIPFEFIFDNIAPEDDAALCPKWRDGLKNGKCATTCDRTSGKHVCPMGFWGLQKVIERHAMSPDLAATGRELFLQSEVSTQRPAIELAGVSVFGASDRVKDASLKTFVTAIKDAAGKKAEKAKDWEEWMAAVKRTRPKLLVAFAHNDGKGFNATLEIGGKALKSVLLRETHLRADAQDPPPLVALLGCDTVGTADDYGNHAAMFRSKGAAIVIATIATVLGDHAARVGECLVAGLLAKDATAPTRVGEILRAIKRQALLDKQMMPLCLVAYGDADWRIKRN
jgi:hypothetical protein